MAMVNDEPAKWRNFAAWSAAGAAFYALAMWGLSSLLHEEGTGAMFRSTEVVAKIGLALLFATACVGFSSRNRSLNLRTFRNFLIQNAVAILAFLLVIWGFSGLARTDVSVSEWIAAVTGATLVVVAVLGGLATASVHTGLHLVDDEMAAEDLRERGRLMLCSFIWTACYGLLLIGLGLAGAGVLSPAATLAGALVLIAILTLLTIAAWRLQDELGRTLSHEAGNMAFYLIFVIGGGWAMLAHLGFARAPAPLDWLTMVTVLLFAASFIVLGRRKLLTR